MMQTKLYTIGYGNRKIEDFIMLLKKYEIKLLVDIRSTPYSRFRPSFNKNVLEQYLLNENIDYSYDSGNLSSIPLYVTARYVFRNSTDINPYIKVNLGYSINSGDTSVNLNNFYSGKLVEEYKSEMKNGIFYGLGFGVEYKNFLVDLTYDITQSKAEEKIYNYEDKEGFSDDYKFDIKKLTLSFGYQFNF